MSDNPWEDFQALCTTISSVYDLRGIGVMSVRVSHDLWLWMKEAEVKSRKSANCFSWAGEQSYREARVAWKVGPSGVIRAKIRPYGADRHIPVWPGKCGRRPWRIVAAYRTE